MNTFNFYWLVRDFHCHFPRLSIKNIRFSPTFPTNQIPRATVSPDVQEPWTMRSSDVSGRTKECKQSVRCNSLHRQSERDETRPDRTGRHQIIEHQTETTDDTDRQWTTTSSKLLAQIHTLNTISTKSNRPVNRARIMLQQIA